MQNGASKRVLTKDLPSSAGNGCAGNTALVWFENIPARRYRLRRLIRLPTHIQWGGRYPPAEALSSAENQAHGKFTAKVDFLR